MRHVPRGRPSVWQLSSWQLCTHTHKHTPTHTHTHTHTYTTHTHTLTRTHLHPHTDALNVPKFNNTRRLLLHTHTHSHKLTQRHTLTDTHTHTHTDRPTYRQSIHISQQTFLKVLHTVLQHTVFLTNIFLKIY